MLHGNGSRNGVSMTTANNAERRSKNVHPSDKDFNVCTVSGCVFMCISGCIIGRCCCGEGERDCGSGNEHGMGWGLGR